MTTSVVCAGCGARAAPSDPYPFRCPRAGTDDVDHVMVPVLDLAGARYPAGRESNPFVRYRTLLHSYRFALDNGLSDEEYVDVVERLDASVAQVDGHGFEVTPFARDSLLSDVLGFTDPGGVWVKNEAGNVSGSHKGRHLMGVQLDLDVADRLRLEPDPLPDLGIASCGNAALAAAVVARAAGRRLHVFVPPDADTTVLARLHELEADVVACPREPGVPGDPCYVRLRAELARGMLPYTCQGNENGLAIEGGQTLSYEMVSALADSGGPTLDHVVVQVGGGALASAVIRGFDHAVALQAVSRLPRLHTVQTTGAHPLQRAWQRVRALLPPQAGRDDVAAAMQTAATQRSQFMWPWEDEPKSIAHGILDDETYDWRAVVDGMLRTGGCAVVVTEDVLAEANDLACVSSPIPVDPTGSAGLAGLIALRRDGTVLPEDKVAVLFTGVRR